MEWKGFELPDPGLGENWEPSDAPVYDLHPLSIIYRCTRCGSHVPPVVPEPEGTCPQCHGERSKYVALRAKHRLVEPAQLNGRAVTHVTQAEVDELCRRRQEGAAGFSFPGVSREFIRKLAESPIEIVEEYEVVSRVDVEEDELVSYVSQHIQHHGPRNVRIDLHWKPGSIQTVSGYQQGGFPVGRWTSWSVTVGYALKAS